MRNHAIVVVALVMIGLGVVVLPWVPTVLLPLSVLFWIGLGSSWAGILLGTQISIATPDRYRARLGSIMGFMCTGIMPLGVAVAGLMIAQWGLTTSLVCIGGVMVLLTPLILFVPLFNAFMNSPASETGDFFQRHYPAAFD